MIDQDNKGGSHKPGSNKLWGGRFEEATDAFVEAFTASVGFDQRLAEVDIRGSVAHATMLCAVGVLTDGERAAVEEGLQEIRGEILAGTFQWCVSREDVHMNIEARLIEKIGNVGKKLHTGRSRNDQVATDLRLYVRERIDQILVKLRKLQLGLVTLAEQESETIMPGFTHLQTAQPISFGHHLLAWVEMLVRDEQRLVDARRRVNQCPLGAAALAGTSYPIDRELTAKLLGFEGVCQNALDAVSDRDFAIEVTSAASLLMMHLSRCSEEMILWTCAQFDFIELPDRFCTGSSIMPQKKNPDVPELVRGKTGRVYGSLMSLLTLMKSQPLAYNKDNQEDKEPLFDTLDTLDQVLTAFVDMASQMKPKRENMLRAANVGFSTATDLADYLVKRGVAFRDAHEIVGQGVRLAIHENKRLAQLELSQLQSLSACIDETVYDVLTLEGSVKSRDHLGGTSPNQVRANASRHKVRLTDV